MIFDQDDHVALPPSSHPPCAQLSLTLAQLAEPFVPGTGDNWAAFRSRLFFPSIVLEASASALCAT